MKFEELSLQQLKTLADLGVEPFLGYEGARFVESLIRTAEYDPSTASTKLQESLDKIIELKSEFVDYLDATEALGFANVDQTEDPDNIVIRIGFQNEAGIEHLTHWKDSAKDWYDIIRGVAMAADEAPENTKVVGASTGSIILILSATAAVTGLLALISKNLTSVAKDVVSVGNVVEDLRAKKLLNREIEKHFKELQKDKKAQALETIMAEVRQRLPNITPDQVANLEPAIKKLLTFNEKGGSVDFVAPPEEQTGSDDGTDAADRDERETMKQVRNLIQEYQAMREQVKLLEDHSEKN